MINDCINIEKNIENINKINEDIKNYNSKNFNYIPLIFLLKLIN